MKHVWVKYQAEHKGVLKLNIMSNELSIQHHRSNERLGVLAT